MHHCLAQGSKSRKNRARFHEDIFRDFESEFGLGTINLIFKTR